MKYISQTMDFISYENGKPGVSVTSVITRYYISDNKTSAPTNTDNGWNTDFDSILDTYNSNKKTSPEKTYYIWSQEMVTYDSAPNSYSTPTVNSANSVIANWCMENDITKINGAHIETGTLSASQITTGTLDADQVTVINLDASQITTGTLDAGFINVPDLNAFDATIGGWEITQNKLKSDGISLITEDIKAESLVNGGQSKIKIVAGTSTKLVSKMLSCKVDLDEQNDGSESFIIQNNIERAHILRILDNLNNEVATNYIKNEYIDYSGNTITIQISLYSSFEQEGGNYVIAEVVYEYYTDGDPADSSFIVLEDGSLYTKHVKASGGSIGGWQISQTDLQKSFDWGEDQYTVTLNTDTPYDMIPNALEIRRNGDYTCVINASGGISSYGAGSRVNCKFSVKDGEVEQKGTSTSLKISGSQYIATGSEYNYDTQFSDILTYGEYEMLTLPWLISFSHISGDGNTRTPLGSIYADGNGYTERKMWDRMNISGDWYVIGNITGSSSGAISSDKNLKNTIKEMSQQDNYDILFDKLTPCTFKYNNGTSDRTHMGFIAQDVKGAADVANIDLQELAAVCIAKNNNGEEEWSLRYEEFVALNTMQIQKLKARVAELEEKNSKLEERLSKIEALLDANE